MLLLVVLALLAMFGLIAVAFVVMSGQAQRSAKCVKRIELVTDPPQKLLQQAVMQVLRGTSGTASGIGSHSLLEDMYGYNYVSGSLTFAAGSVTSAPQFLTITLTTGSVSLKSSGTITAGTTTAGTTTTISLSDSTAPTLLGSLAGHVGCVLTITNVNDSTYRALVGQSTRIVAASPSTATIMVLAFPCGLIPPAGSAFTINGVPFSGTGFGYDATGHSLTATVGTLTATSRRHCFRSDETNRYPLGGANSDYTAADFQHMLLAAQVPIDGPAASNAPLAAPPRAGAILGEPKPASAVTQGTASWATVRPDTVAMFRQVMARPIGSFAAARATADHPDFTGSNPNFNPAWDGVTPVGNGRRPMGR